MHNRHADCILQFVEIFLDALLGLANVNNQLRISCSNGFLVEIALAAVDLAEDGQGCIFLADVRLLCVVHLIA